MSPYLKMNKFNLIGHVLILSFLITLSQAVPFQNLDCTLGSGSKTTCNWTPISLFGSTWSNGGSEAYFKDIQYDGPARGPPITDSYMKVNKPSTPKFNNAALDSPKLDSKTGTDCFSFYYYIYGENVGSLELQLHTTGGSAQGFWRRTNSAGDMWHLARVNIGPQTATYSLKFAISSVRGSIALSYFKTLPGSCQSDLCDFEGGNCNWTSSSTNPSYQFKLIRAGESSSVTQNEYDHTTDTTYGHFMEAFGGNIGDTTTLTSPTLPHLSGPYCLKLWYWRHISQNNLIEIYYSTSSQGTFTKRWESDYTYPIRTWHRGQVQLYYPYQIQIRATKKSSQLSQIDIDDISLVNGYCDEPVTCNFDRDMCGWTRDLKQTWIWDHGIGRVEKSSSLPSSIDHAPIDESSHGKGMFMYTDFTSYNDNRVVTMNMVSEFVPKTISPIASCLTFYYMPLAFSKANNQFNILLKDSNDTQIKQVFSLNKLQTSSSQWIKTQVDISTTQAYRIVFQVTTDNGGTYLAIDDIKYRTGACSSTGISTLPPIPTTVLPIASLSCNFRGSFQLCGWTSSLSSITWVNTQWKVGYASLESGHPYQPKGDHTTGSSEGGYAYIYHSSTDASYNNINQRKAVMTVTNKQTITAGTTTPFCFTLWYFMKTSGYVELNITVSDQNKNIVRADTRQNGQGEEWHMMQLEAPGDKTGYVYSISALARLGQVSIDDITVVHQTCQQSDPNTFRCTFEGGHNCSFAPVYKPEEMTLVWQIYKGSETSIKTHDHTLKTLFGHYFALDFHKLSTSNVPFNYEFISEYFRPTRQSCVTFSYYMYGLSKNESLTFYMVNSTLGPSYGRPFWSAYGDLQHFWYSHRMTVSSTAKWKIMFGGQTHTSTAGIIAIDDVIVELDKPCPPKGFCDFERRDTCMWESIPPTFDNIYDRDTKRNWINIAVGTPVYNQFFLNYTDFEWVVHSPDYSSSSIYPTVDHTLGKRSGNYLLLKAESPRRITDRAVLVSDHYDIPTSGSFCVKLYYFVNNMNTYGTSRFELYQAENNQHYQKLAEVIGTTSNTTWVQFQVTAKALSTSSKNMWFYLIGDVGSIGSAIGIDDISITPGNCGLAPINNTFICKPSNQTIPKSKLCDGIKDCANGADELDCGSCSFRNGDDCNYQISSSGSVDKLGYTWRVGNYTDGPKGGPYGTYDYMVARAYRYNRYIESSQLISPKIHGAESNCVINFYYNINGNTSSRAPDKRWEHLSISLNRSGFESTQIWSTDVMNPTPNVWHSGYAVVGKVVNQYQITFTAMDLSPTDSPTTYGYVALASIRLSGCKRNDTPPDSCSSYYYQCRNRRCISKNYVCDNSDDCGDGSDETVTACANYKLRCDFENGMCGWGLNRRDSWAVDNGYSKLSSGPTRDHTKGIRTGKFLTMMSTHYSNKTSKITGPVLQKSSGCMMRFWYSMEGNTTSTGRLMIGGEDLSTGLVTTFWRTYLDDFPIQSFGFERDILRIYDAPQTFRMVIIGNLSKHDYNSQASYIAIDDISFSPECIVSTGQSSTTPIPIRTTIGKCGSQFQCKQSGACIDTTKVCNFHDDCGDGSDEANCGSCAFEGTDSDGKPLMCGWRNVGYGKNQWSVISASQASRFSELLRNTDASKGSSGHYLIVDSSKGGTGLDASAIIETPVLGKTAPACRITFYYSHMYPSGTYPRLEVRLYRSGWTPYNKLLLTAAPSSVRWTQYSAHIGQMPSGYHVRFYATGTVYSSLKPYIDMALDDIKFVDCDPSANVTTPSSLTCDFENGTCGWYDWNMASNNRIDWVRTNSERIDPGYDHTGDIKPTPARHGTWIYTQRQQGMYGNNTATLMSTAAQPLMTGTKCLSFWYHMFGKNPANFSLLINVNRGLSSTATLLWIKRQPVSNNWMLAQVNIPPQNNAYYLMFRASLPSTSKDTIALDDISYTDGACPTTPICDFEVDFCGWSSSPGNIKRITPITASNTYPPIDHTLGAADGHYVKVNVPNQVVTLTYKITADFTQNITQPGPPTPNKSMCLKFWYYMGISPPSAGTLSSSDYFGVSLVSTSRTTVLDSTSGYTIKIFNIQNQWLYKRVNFKAAVNDVVSIKGHTSIAQSVVAFDDIQIQKQSCEQPGWCDFENDMCGWSNLGFSYNSKPILWTRNSGITESDNSGPRRDHTTDTDEGWYVYVPEDAQSNGVAILQSEILGPYSGQMCFSFWYHIMSETRLTSPKLVVQYYDSSKSQTKVLANISSRYVNSWFNFNITLSALPKIRFSLKTVLGQTSKADVAIDDISIKYGACGQTVSTVPPPTPTPVGSNLWDCSFEKTCKWAISGTGWTKSSWYLNRKVGPRDDHTFHDQYGHYLLYDGSTTNAGNPLIFTSDAVTAPYKSTTACLSLWYYIDSESRFNLTMGYYTSSSQTYYPLYRLPNIYASHSWRKMQANFYASATGNKMSIQLQHSTPFSGGVAIDDIKLTMGACKYDSGIECDFNNGYCGYQVIHKSVPSSYYYAGYIANGKTIATRGGYGPTADHTTGDPTSGYFFYFNRPNAQARSYETQLIINDQPSTGFRAQCLKFWYQINSPTNSSFNIYVTPTTSTTYRYPTWVVPYTNFYRWTRGQVTIFASYKHKIVFDMNLGTTAQNNSFVALDDISVTSGQCEPPLTCDFDTDMCSWSNGFGTAYNYNWAKFTGPPGINTKWIGPRFDHTLGRAGGSYLYVTPPPNNGNTYKNALIESMMTPMKTVKCLSFWVQMIGNDTRVQTYLYRYGDKGRLQTTLLGPKPIVGPKSIWTKISYTIDPSNYPNTTVFSVLINGAIQKSTSFIALDDIVLSGGQCPNTGPQELFCKGTQKLYGPEKRCNFVYDCPYKDDEDNCGNCDFEKDTCLWGNRYVNGEQWIRKAAVNSGLPVGPNVDGSGSSSGHYLIVNPARLTSQLIRADLMSNSSTVNTMKRSYFTCRMTFKYYMSATALKRNSTFIYINLGSNYYSYRSVWRMTAQVMNQWTTASAAIGEEDGNFSVDIYGATPGPGTTIAIDNIQFNNCGAPAPTTGSCPTNQIKCQNNVCMSAYGLCDNTNDCGDNSDESGSNCAKIKVNPCTFEADVGTRYACNWTQEFDSGSINMWTNMTAVSAYTNINMLRMTGPTFDHTYQLSKRGTFLVLKGTPKYYGKSARFVTRMLTSQSGQTCALRFYYYMFGANVGSLTISVRYADQSNKSKTKPQVITGNQGQQWVRAIYPFSDQKAFQFIIEGQLGNGPQSDIAIDDVSFSEGCATSDKKSIIVSTTTHSGTGGPSVTPTKSGPIKRKSDSDGKKSNGGKIAAGVLVPVFVIGAVLAFLFYRRQKQRSNDEDRAGIMDRVHYDNETGQTNIKHNGHF